MKIAHTFILGFLLVMLSFQSCEQGEFSEGDEFPVAQKSIALRITMNSILIESDSITEPTLSGACFNFSYPITFEYNTGTLVTVENKDGLIAVLSNETTDLYIIATVMPFDVVLEDGDLLTISNEEDFFTLLESCDTIVIPFAEETPNSCFEFVFPFQVITTDESIYTIGSDETFDEFLSEHMYDWDLEFVYPLEVINVEGETIVVTNEYDFFEILTTCDYGCDCYTDYDPVCVETDFGIIEFPNACEAECEGFLEADFIDCEPIDSCMITYIDLDVSGCEDDSYSVTIEINYTLSPMNENSFELYDLYSETIIGVYLLSDLPLTIEDFPIPYSGFDSDYLIISLFNSDLDECGCGGGIDYVIPNCE